MLRIIHKKVRQAPEVKMIPDKSEALRELVGGYLEAIHIAHGFCCVLNEEGVLLGLKPHGMLLALRRDGVVGYDIAGDIFFTKVNEEGDYVSLTEDEVISLLEVFEEIFQEFEEGKEPVLKSDMTLKTYDDPEEFFKDMGWGKK